MNWIINLFLQTAPEINSSAAGTITAIILGLLVFFLILTLITYIYGSFAFMAISRKTGVGPAGIAWIPFIGKPILASRIAKMHWWPILLMLVYLLMPLRDIIGQIALMSIVWIGSIIFGVYWIIWGWKVFKVAGRPGWWMILTIIPILGWILYLVFLGIAAWGKGKDVTTQNFI